MATVATMNPITNSPDSVAHLNMYLSQIEEQKIQLQDCRNKIELCKQQSKPITSDLQKLTLECMDSLRDLQKALRQHNSIHLERKRIIWRRPYETKCVNPKRDTSSSSSKTRRKEPPLWYKQAHVKKLRDRINTRVQRHQNRFQNIERASASSLI